MFPVNFEKMANTHPSLLARQFFQKSNKMLPQDMQLVVRAIVDVLHYWVNVGDTNIVTDSELRIDMATASEESDGLEEIMESHTNKTVSEISSFINTYRAIRALRSFTRLQEIGLLEESENPYDILKLQNLNPNKQEKQIGDDKEDYLEDFVFTDEPLDKTWDWADIKEFINNGKSLENE